MLLSNTIPSRLQIQEKLKNEIVKNIIGLSSKKKPKQTRLY